MVESNSAENQWVRTPTVLVVDDERLIADTLSEILRAYGYDATAVYTATTALDRATDSPPDLLITDVALDPDSINGIDLAIYFGREYSKCKVLLISGHAATLDLLARARAAGHDFLLLNKPISPNVLLGRVYDLLAHLRRSVPDARRA